MEEENKPELDTLFMKTLEDILKKEPRELTKQDKAFLKARWHYVRSKTARDIFKDVVFGEEEVIEEELVEEKGKTQPKKEVKKQDTITTTITEQDEEESDSNNPFEKEEDEE